MAGRDWIALVGAVLVHGTLAAALAHAPSMVRKEPQVVEVTVHRIEPPPPVSPPPPEPEPPPLEPPKPPPRVHHVKTPPPVAQAPIPNKTEPPPPTPPKEPPKPVFGVSMDSVTEGDSAVAVPVGNTTVADPSSARPGQPVAPLAPAPPHAAPGPVYRPASGTWLASDPTLDAASCTTTYPEGEARELGVEGQSVLRVHIDEHGKVRGVKLIKGVGYGLDEEAMRMLRTRCRFGPAYDKHHQPVPTAITYTVTWTLD